ncbi:putative Mce family protein [Mycobacteroides stephanolepidis]|uniref:Putative Mce family protein n=1 Tax=[Mycobacterium] stephanolepidis TaxID=1520670 RepID=A0A1Z4ET96_9MYCO|nr:MCE family protein [[Mycobacterium] stephanolepidis]BAX96190.1 putative Mce family protein [[Mycobacterium] stephanolepidis]
MNRRRPVIAVAVTVALLAIVAAIAIPRFTERTLRITAQFEDTVGLYEGNAVSLLGMQIGEVTAIAPQDGYVEVQIDVDGGVDLPADVHAVTVSTSILTDRHVELTPPYRGGPKLKNGDALGLMRTRTPVEFDRTLTMVDKLSRALGGDGQGQGPLADLVGASSQIATGNGEKLKETLGQLSHALRLGTDQGAGSQKNIQSIVANLAELTQASADNDTAIREFGSNLRQLSDILADENLGAGTTGAKVNQILAQATALLENNRDRLKNTVNDFGVVTTAISDYRREMSEFFDLLPLVVDNFDRAIDPNAGVVRAHLSIDKVLLDGQFAKEVCNLIQKKQLGCATGTMQDYAPDFGLTSMLQIMAETR